MSRFPQRPARVLLPFLLILLGLPVPLATAQGMPTAAAPESTPAPVSFTAAQIERGHAEYRRSCLDCHGAQLNDGEFGGAPLKGSSFKEKWFGITADALYGFISSAMPPDRPGRLNPQTYADLTAYILNVNGIQPGSTELPSDLDKLAGLMVE